MKAPYFCPVCNSDSWQKVSPAQNSGFSVGKAAVGGILLGPIGIAAGALGKKRAMWHCYKCGYSAEFDV